MVNNLDRSSQEGIEKYIDMMLDQVKKDDDDDEEVIKKNK